MKPGTSRGLRSHCVGKSLFTQQSKNYLFTDTSCQPTLPKCGLTSTAESASWTVGDSLESFWPGFCSNLLEGNTRGENKGFYSMGTKSWLKSDHPNIE